MTKKVITLIGIQKISNRRQKNLEDKTKIFTEIKLNIIYSWLIRKGI